MEKQLTLRLERRLYEEIDAAARRLRRSRSDVVRIAIEAYLAGGAGTRSAAETPWTLVTDLVGTAESGRSDLGSSHREQVLTRIRESRARWQES